MEMWSKRSQWTLGEENPFTLQSQTSNWLYLSGEETPTKNEANDGKKMWKEILREPEWLIGELQDHGSSTAESPVTKSTHFIVHVIVSWGFDTYSRRPN